MKFPRIGDIATTFIIQVKCDDSISEALSLMLEYDHRSIIVINGNDFKVLTVLDILNAQKKGLSLYTSISELKLHKVPVISKEKNVLDTLEYLNEPIEYICVVDGEGALYGIITHTDITSNIDPDTLMDNYKLIDYLKLGRRMKWVAKETVLSDILHDMAKRTFDNVIVVDNMKPLGILTTKDIMRLIRDEVDMDKAVSFYMSSPVDTIHKDSSVKEALDFIKEKHYKRVVVVDDNGNLSGIVTQKELISLTYYRWAIIMREYQKELDDLNKKLQTKNKEYEIMASTDSLTSLYNRYKFSELYLSAYKSMLQRHSHMSLIILDIDFFKKINDRYGHNEGDRVLVSISRALLDNLRDIDIVCRWGGEEFVVLLPTASMQNAVKIANKLRKAVEELRIDGLNLRCSASFGVAGVREGEEMQDVIARADKALYLAKNSGRNCIKTENDL